MKKAPANKPLRVADDLSAEYRFNYKKAKPNRFANRMKEGPFLMLIEKSLQIALRAYAGETDKAGREYILHPLRVMAKMTTDLGRSAALLHDVLEDSDITAEELLAEGIPVEVVEAVQCLSKNEGEDYLEFVARAKTNPLARRVKIADIEDNIDILRLTSLAENDLERIQRYHAAWRLLQEE